jgi:hypothetical protein
MPKPGIRLSGGRRSGARSSGARLLAAALLCALAAGAPAQQKGGKKLYCWDENGRKVCGDALPADAAGAARTVFNASTGTRAGQVARALTPEERAAAELAAAEAARTAAERAAIERRDQAMAQSYNTEADLRDAFQERIDLLDETVKASRLGVAALRQSLISLLRQAGELELAGKRVPKATAGNIASQHAELRRRERMLVQQLADRAALDDELARVLARYRELKQPAMATAPAAATSG